MDYKTMAKAIVDGVPADRRGPDITITLSRIEWEMLLAKSEGSFRLSELAMLLVGSAQNTIADTVAQTRALVYDEERQEWRGTN